MHRYVARGQIRPKISTLPRQQSEAAAFLDIHKLVIEKKRLQQELQNMDQRRQQIINRLAVLDKQVAELETSAHQLRETTAIDPTVAATAVGATLPQPNAYLEPEPSLPVVEFDTLFLEY